MRKSYINYVGLEGGVEVQGLILNPHLEGGSFFWEGGEVGVVLCHGYTATTAEVRPLAKVLRAAGFSLAGPLLPGHGTSPQDMNRCRWQDWAKALEATYLEMTRRCRVVFIGGESMGALLSLYLAARRPDVAGVLSYAGALMVPSRLTTLSAPLLAPFIPYRPKPAGEPGPVDELWQGYTVNPIPAVVQLFKLQKIVRKTLPEIRQPVLVVHGRQDRSVHPGAPEDIYRMVQSKHKEIHWMENSGHCVLLDQEKENIFEFSLNFLHRILASQNTSR